MSIGVVTAKTGSLIRNNPVVIFLADLSEMVVVRRSGLISTVKGRVLVNCTLP